MMPPNDYQIVITQRNGAYQATFTLHAQATNVEEIREALLPIIQDQWIADTFTQLDVDKKIAEEGVYALATFPIPSPNQDPGPPAHKGLTMNEPPELTPIETYHAELFRHPAALFRSSLLSTLFFLVPSIGLMVAWFITRDPVFAIMGYGILLFREGRGIFLTRIGIQRTNRVLKYLEAKNQGKHDVP
jgi:hypothetical protein